jgi:starch phosphorylase
VRTLLDIRAGILPERPVTVIFGAKAAPAYTIAKDIIHAILCLSQVVAEDPVAGKWLKIVMVENYNVAAAEKLIPACDLSEQISLASKEASGTGNMKFMLNGAVTLGTMDGANVEIAELVGAENIYTFGASSDEVIERYRRGDYNPREYLAADPALSAAVDFLTDAKMLAAGDGGCLNRLKNELENKDWFMTFPDFADYCRAKSEAIADYEDAAAWSKKALTNIARAGYFSSDRTIAQYNEEIWKL